jgi:hypothetical protein
MNTEYEDTIKANCRYKFNLRYILQHRALYKDLSGDQINIWGYTAL